MKKTIIWLKRTTLAGAASLLVLFFAAACASHVKIPGVANIVSTTNRTTGSANATPAGSTSSVGFASYSMCMRAHGVKDFPVPNSKGQLHISAHPGSDLDPNSPVFKAANDACKSLNPVNNLSPAQRAQIRAKTLKYSECIRQNGIVDFPDPNSDGSLQIRVQPGSDLNPNSSAYQKALQACQSLAPNRNGGSASSTATSSGGN